MQTDRGMRAVRKVRTPADTVLPNRKASRFGVETESATENRPLTAWPAVRVKR